jgi:DNA-binding protein HU-beta
MPKTAYTSELIDRIATREQLYQRTVSRVVAATLKEIKKMVAQGYHVQLTNFGTFYKSSRKGGRGRNIRTGEPLDVAPYALPSFRAGTAFKKALRKGKKKK